MRGVFRLGLLAAVYQEHELFGGVDVELAVEAFCVPADGPDAERELGGDFLVGFSCGEKREDFALALG